MDDTITRLREWQLERHLASDEQEMKNEETMHFLRDQSSGPTYSVESDGREEDIKNHILKHSAQSRKTEISVIHLLICR